MQWRIQDFLDVGAPTLRGEGGANIRFCQIFLKTAWNWNNLNAEGGGRSSRPLYIRQCNAYFHSEITCRSGRFITQFNMAWQINFHCIQNLSLHGLLQ